MRKALMILGSVAFLSVVAASRANAQWNGQPASRLTVFTFSAPVSLPGVSLPAGSYVFKLADPLFAPNIVEVMSADQKAVYAMVQTTPIERSKSSDKAEITFKETGVGTPAKIDAWFFPDETTGLEMDY